MKKTILYTSGALALAAVSYLVSQLGAQTPATTMTAGSVHGTRIAVLNLAFVIKNYEKFKAFENEMKANLKQYDEQLSAKRTQLEAMTKEAQSPAIAEVNRDELQKKARLLQREIEDITATAKSYIGKKRDEQLVQLYKEVQDAAQRYAMSQGIDMVLHYTDATTDQEFWNPGNVARKMQSAGCMPLYWTANSDISREVVTALNANYGMSRNPAPNATH